MINSIIFDFDGVIINEYDKHYELTRKQIKDILYITQTNHNFIESVNGVTPAIRESLTNKVWSWNDVFNVTLSIKI